MTETASAGPRPDSGPRTTHRQGHVLVALPREIGWHNHATVREALGRALTMASAGSGTGLVVDCGETVALDPSGLVLLARAQVRARQLGVPLRIVVPDSSRQVLGTLGGTGLAALVFPDVESATSRPPGDRRALTPGLTITTQYAHDDDHVHIRLDGRLDEAAASRFGDSLTSMIERDAAHHLMVTMHDRLQLRCDPLPVLMGIRWRAVAAGGCLTLATMPDRLGHIIDREGLRPAFRSCHLLDRAATVS